MSINRVCISGNLTRSPEIRSTPSGMNILNFGMAVNDRRKNRDTGEWEDYANFIDVCVFGNRADFLSKALHKGMKVFVEGKLRYSSWEREGQRRSKLEVIADDIDFAAPKNNAQSQQNGSYAPQNQQHDNYANNQQYSHQQPTGRYQQYSQPQQAGGYENVQTPDVYSSDIPF